MPHRTLPSNGGERNSLRLWMCPGNFHQLDFAVKSHHLDSVIGSIFNLRHLLTRICIDNPFWRYPETLHQLNFSLKKKRLHCKLLINARSRITGKLSHHSPLYFISIYRPRNVTPICPAGNTRAVWWDHFRVLWLAFRLPCWRSRIPSRWQQGSLVRFCCHCI